MKHLKKGTPVLYSQAKAYKPPWKIDYCYGDDVYRIASETEFCDMVPRHMLTPIPEAKLTLFLGDNKGCMIDVTEFLDYTELDAKAMLEKILEARIGLRKMREERKGL